MKIRRSEIWIANLEPSKASEPGKVRPVVIIQSDLMNEANHTSVVVCPLSSQEKTFEGKLRISVKADKKMG